MKTLSIYAALLFSIFALNFSFAQTSVKKETLKVWGNCGMCKKVIEKSAKSAGATYANWNENSKLLKVSYTLNKTSGTQIQQAIANAGYDTQDLTADDAAYNKLPGCCQYDRKSKTDKASMGAMKSCCSKAAGTTMKCADMSKCCKDGDMKSCDKSKCKDAVAGKDGKCCTDKSCCKS